MLIGLYVFSDHAGNPTNAGNRRTITLLLRLAPSWALLQMNLRVSHDFLLVSIRPDVCVITNLSILFQITLKSNVE